MASDSKKAKTATTDTFSKTFLLFGGGCDSKTSKFFTKFRQTFFKERGIEGGVERCYKHFEVAIFNSC